MQINFDENIEPFFQVLINNIEGNTQLTAKLFFSRLKQLINERNNHSSSHIIKLVQPKTIDQIVEDHFFVAYLKHSKVPTWYKSQGKIDLSTINTSNILLNDEFDLIIFYMQEGYSFIHTNCNHILSLIQAVQEEIFVKDGIRFRKLSGEKINIVLSQLEIEYRSLGIQNHFGIGGTAPEAKTYFGRDTSNSLTPSFDAGYGFSYCLGSMSSDDKTLPFGCSKNKSKIWTTWISDLNEFCDQCDIIVKWLNGKIKENKKLEVLVQSISKENLKNASPVEFFLDYFIPDKGLVFIGTDTHTLNWECFYNITEKTITFTWENQNSHANEVIINLTYDLVNEQYDFVYKDPNNILYITFSEDENSTNNNRSKDLVSFLNDQKNFTIIFDLPYAYRDNECWEDNRLKQQFTSISDKIMWADVDITKEEKPASNGKRNILQKIDDYFKTQNDLIFSCNDNGANEVADYIAVFENRLILIHAKFSMEDYPGLRVDDIQVVSAQAAKNIRFYLPASYNDKILKRLYENISIKKKIKDYESFKKKYIEILQNKNITKECWIVQPGISIPELKKDKKNKIHTILNFIESILKVNNVGFQLIANPISKKANNL